MGVERTKGKRPASVFSHQIRPPLFGPQARRQELPPR